VAALCVNLLLTLALATATAQTTDAVRAESRQADSLVWVHPELRPAAEQIASMAGEFRLSEAALPEMRTMRFDTRPPLEDITAEKRQIDGPPGAPDLTVLIINARATGSRPGILHTHGGGYVLGNADGDLVNLQNIAQALDCVIVSVEYRLAPETRYTGSIEDNYAALSWMHANAAKLGIDRTRIAVMGESAGGGHAALLALTARDRGGIPIVLQVLIYPMLDDRTGSSRPVPAHIGTLGWTAESNRFGWGAFLGQAPGTDRVPEAAVPARVEDLTGLPPAFIAVGGLDLFVDEDIEYAQRLIDAGVPTELLVVPGAFHGFDVMARETNVARRFTHAKIDALRRAFENAARR
jgi:acetyl esterase/lipase